MSIKLSEILNVNNPKEYKVHLANWNGENQPLDIFVQDLKKDGKVGILGVTKTMISIDGTFSA